MIEWARQEIKEKIGIKVFSGDTVGNFLRCASISDRNTVLYDKSQLPPPAHRETFTDASGSKHPIYRAVVKAKELHDIPLIMESYLSRMAPYPKPTMLGKYDHIILPEGEQLPVTYVWTPKNDSWRDADFIKAEITLSEFFTKRNAREYLERIANYE